MINKKLYVLFFLLIANVSFAQRDRFFETWTSIEAKKKFNTLTFSIEEAWRIREFYLSRQNYTDFSVMKKNNNFKFGGGYRLIFKNSYVRFQEISNRFYLDAEVTAKHGTNISFTYRPRLQYSLQSDESDLGVKYQFYWRNKFQFSYNANDEFSIDASYEPFLYFEPGHPYINENRFSFSANYKISKSFSLALGYSLRNFVRSYASYYINVLNTDFSFKF